MVEKNFTVKTLWAEGQNGILISWEGLSVGDTGKPYKSWFYADKSVQVKGVFGVAGKCVIEGSNMNGTPSWATLSDPQGNILEMSIASIETILENPYQIRPNITAGDETTLIDVYLLMR